MPLLSPARRRALRAFAEKHGLTFTDWALLDLALTHPSYRNEHPEVTGDNERLEFLGDALLDFLAAEWLYRRHPELDEGEMTRWRARLVQGEQLARFAEDLGLEAVLQVGRGEAESWERARISILADAFEALLGALYLDQGLEAVRRFVVPRLAQAQAAWAAQGAPVNPKTRLQEWTQARGLGTPRYVLVRREGPDHAPRFWAAVQVAGREWGRGVGPSKRAAEQAAAEQAWQRREQLARPADSAPEA